ncbi:XRE family transcriptional regulator [Asanoa sp. NPDC049518]|uniref:helix-turn-helix domain-containing protein n=1 Tax=unclassified Asanoa TaxID=2685164 RepID=UPI00344229F8
MSGQTGMPPIGERLRQARLDRGMTVRGLARVVDTSASLISQIETGKSNPSVSTLYAITAALGISVEDIFNEPDPASPRPARLDTVAPVPAALGAAISAALIVPAQPSADQAAGSATAQGLRMLSQRRRVGPVVPAGEREVLHLDSGVTWELLGQLPDTHVDFLRITYAPGGSSSGAGVLMRHSGTEWGHVLAGQLTLTLGFDTHVLNPGDSVSFDCSTPHSYANHGVEPAVGIWFVAERFS